ncbi:MAG: hypothetical protein ABJD07_10480 [Gemmatimonadaceae bacterium]
MAIATMTVGCYTYTPIAGLHPDSGAELDLQLNDAGRVGVGSRLGPEIDHIAGNLVSMGDGAYVLRVQRIVQLGGSEQAWAGETLTVKQDFLKNVQERKFSKNRSVLAAGIFALAIGAFIAGRSLLGLGADDGGKPTCCVSGQ